MKFVGFENMEIRQLSMKLLKQIYKISNQGDFKSDYGLRDQIRRATVSVSSSIVEGFERQNNNEFIRFLKIAQGSCLLRGQKSNIRFMLYMIYYRQGIYGIKGYLYHNIQKNILLNNISRTNQKTVKLQTPTFQTFNILTF
ncbi:MAG TPA: four helix bundle protein [Candidatus Absconditabacterales bacterium]|nr:four helix bundle protein [Candidatus Absconditabacterales bacterium]